MLENLSIKPKEAFKTSEIDFKKIHSDTFVDVSEVLQRPPIALSFGKNHKDYDIPLVTYGNFMCIVGASKSMKTFLKSALLSSYISGPKNSFFNDIEVLNQGISLYWTLIPSKASIMLKWLSGV